MKLVPEFLLSATSPAQFPASAAPEFAFLGRSNVGKSSLLNALVGERIARTSSSPGRTRAINFFALSAPRASQPRMLFADLPGYGYAKISKSISAEWPAFINPYLAGRPGLALCLCLADSNVPPQASDRQLLDSLRAMERPFLVVATKADRLSGNGRTRARLTLERELNGEVLLCSSKTSLGLAELWARIHAAADAAAGHPAPHAVTARS